MILAKLKKKFDMFEQDYKACNPRPILFLITLFLRKQQWHHSIVLVACLFLLFVTASTSAEQTPLAEGGLGKTYLFMVIWVVGFQGRDTKLNRFFGQISKFSKENNCIL